MRVRPLVAAVSPSLWLTLLAMGSTRCASTAHGSDALDTVDAVVDTRPDLITDIIEIAPDVPVDTRDVPLTPVDVVFVDDAPVTMTCGTPPMGHGVCEGLCGNGIVDNCRVCMPCGFPPDAGVCCVTNAEPCDGAPTQTCMDLGLRGGTTACTTGCQHDTSGCLRCSDDLRVVACQAPAMRQSVAANFGLAVASDRIALAWATIDPASTDNPSGTLQLELLNETLGVVSRAPCLAVPGIQSASTARLPDGWLVAYGTTLSGGVYLQRYDNGAQPHGGPAFVGAGGNPRLTAGDGAVYLLEYEVPADSGITVSAVLLHADGTAVADAQTVFQGIYSLDHESAVWLGDAFLLAAREFRRPSDAEAIVRIDRDGTVRSYTQPVGQNTEYGQLLLDGGRITLWYGAFGGTPAMRLQALDTMGRPVGPALELLSAGALNWLNYGVAYPVFFGGDFFVLQADHGAPWSLQGVSFDASFQPSTRLWPVGRGGNFGINDRVRTAVLGTRLVAPRVIVAWTDMTPTYDRALSIAAIVP